jgi:hypothetical protein
MEKNVITPCMHWSTRSGSCVLPLKSPKVQATIRRPSKSSMGCSGSVLGVGWIPSTTVNPQPWIYIIFLLISWINLQTVHLITLVTHVLSGHAQFCYPWSMDGRRKFRINMSSFLCWRKNTESARQMHTSCVETKDSRRTSRMPVHSKL